MELDHEKSAFLDAVDKELHEGNLAIFAGAGLSVSAGFVNWSELLRPIAKNLGLDIDREHDLVTLAQYHCNVNGGNRSELNQILIEKFSEDVELTENHKILSRLPISNFWTTNYDKLLEKSLEEAGKRTDVKYTKKQLALTKPKRDAVVYKMHGDVEHPNEAVLTKDDYEKYHLKMDQFLSNLKGELISRTFIFIGFSFTDPNLDYILSRVRVSFEKDQRKHYCFLRKEARGKGESKADYEYRIKKQELFISDLKRFNIQTVLVDEYSEITELLKLIEKRYKKNTIFISGAAHEYTSWNEGTTLQFIHSLSKSIIKKGFNIVSGFGLGVGNAVIGGALEQIYMKPKDVINDQLILRPFPQVATGSQPLDELWERYRSDMISHSGIAIFMLGNKLEDEQIVISDGMIKEFEIAHSLDVKVVPIGALGYAGRHLWEKVKKDFETYYSDNPKLEGLFFKLGDSSLSPKDLSDTIFDFLIALKES